MELQKRQEWEKTALKAHHEIINTLKELPKDSPYYEKNKHLFESDLKEFLYPGQGVLTVTSKLVYFLGCSFSIGKLDYGLPQGNITINSLVGGGFIVDPSTLLGPRQYRVINGSTRFPGFVQLEIYHGPSIVGTFVGSTSGGEEIIDRTGTLTPM